MCDGCDEEMQKYDEDTKKEWREEFFCCENCNRKKLRRILFNPSGATISDETEDYLG